jgi:GNAT superfamily N-acetyltransferase
MVCEPRSILECLLIHKVLAERVAHYEGTVNLRAISDVLDLAKPISLLEFFARWCSFAGSQLLFALEIEAMLPLNLRGLLGRVRRMLRRFICMNTVCLFSGRHLAETHAIKSDAQIDFRIPSPTEVASYLDELQLHFGLSAGQISERFEHGNKIIVALHAGQVVAMLWMAFDQQVISEVGSILVLGDDDFVTFHAVTLPAWRNIGLSTALNCAAYEHAVTLNRRVQWAWRSTGNRQALRVAAKLGQTPVCIITAVWFCGLGVWRRVRNLDPNTAAPSVLRTYTA